MGILRYGSPERRYSIDDRTLAHLAVAIIDELRRGEVFSLTIGEESGPTALLISRNVPLRFDFENSARVPINAEWVRELEDAVHSAHSLGVLHEPAERARTADRTGELIERGRE